MNFPSHQETKYLNFLISSFHRIVNCRFAEMLRYYCIIICCMETSKLYRDSCKIILNFIEWEENYVNFCYLLFLYSILFWFNLRLHFQICHENYIFVPLPRNNFYEMPTYTVDIAEYLSLNWERLTRKRLTKNCYNNNIRILFNRFWHEINSMFSVKNS